MLLRALIVITLLASAGPAVAGDARCIWQKLPESAREAYLLAGVKGERPDLSTFFSDAQVNTAVDGCNVSDAALDPAGVAFSGYSSQLIAERRLEITAGVYPDRLDAAWAALDPVLIAQLGKAVAAGTDDGSGLKVWESLVAALTPQATDQRALRQGLVPYMSARAMRQAAEKLY